MIRGRREKKKSNGETREEKRRIGCVMKEEEKSERWLGCKKKKGQNDQIVMTNSVNSNLGNKNNYFLIEIEIIHKSIFLIHKN